MGCCETSCTLGAWSGAGASSRTTLSAGVKLRRYTRAEDIVATDVPHPRIVDDLLWKRVQLRLQTEAAPIKAGPDGPQSAFWERRRPRHLLSGKVFCGVCSRPFSVSGQDYLGCMAAAHGTCRNRSRVRRGALEAQVMDALVGG